MQRGSAVAEAKCSDAPRVLWPLVGKMHSIISAEGVRWIPPDQSVERYMHASNVGNGESGNDRDLCVLLVMKDQEAEMRGFHLSSYLSDMSRTKGAMFLRA